MIADEIVLVSPAVVDELKRIIRDSEITKYVPLHRGQAASQLQNFYGL
jgi:hypothetical protein